MTQVCVTDDKTWVREGSFVDLVGLTEGVTTKSEVRCVTLLARRTGRPIQAIFRSLQKSSAVYPFLSEGTLGGTSGGTSGGILLGITGEPLGEPLGDPLGDPTGQTLLGQPYWANPTGPTLLAPPRDPPRDPPLGSPQGDPPWDPGVKLGGIPGGIPRGIPVGIPGVSSQNPA